MWPGRAGDQSLRGTGRGALPAAGPRKRKQMQGAKRHFLSIQHPTPAPLQTLLLRHWRPPRWGRVPGASESEVAPFCLVLQRQNPAGLLLGLAGGGGLGG